jgi:hypothetical protein
MGGDKPFVNTGYGTHWGSGNVENQDVRHEKGTGYDSRTGQVKKPGGKWPVQYDPVTGQISEDMVTDKYNFPMSPDIAGLADVSAEATSHATHTGEVTHAQEEKS